MGLDSGYLMEEGPNSEVVLLAIVLIAKAVDNLEIILWAAHMTLEICSDICSRANPPDMSL